MLSESLKVHASNIIRINSRIIRSTKFEAQVLDLPLATLSKLCNLLSMFDGAINVSDLDLPDILHLFSNIQVLAVWFS